MEVSGQLHFPAAVPPDTHRIGGWVGPRAVLDAVVNSAEKQIAQNVRYTTGSQNVIYTLCCGPLRCEPSSS